MRNLLLIIVLLSFTVCTKEKKPTIKQVTIKNYTYELSPVIKKLIWIESTGKLVDIYNRKGQLIEEVHYHIDGNILTKKNNEYNSKGLKVKSFNFAGNYLLGPNQDELKPMENSKSLYSYDINNNLVEESIIFNDGRISKTHYEYKDNVLIKEIFTHSSGNVTERNIVPDEGLYNENGLIISKKFDDGSRYEYIYDTKSNLVEKKYYSPNVRTKRNYRYNIYNKLEEVIFSRFENKKWEVRGKKIYEYEYYE